MGIEVLSVGPHCPPDALQQLNDRCAYRAAAALACRAFAVPRRCLGTALVLQRLDAPTVSEHLTC